MSCEVIDSDENAFQLLVGRDASELRIALGEAQRAVGDRSNAKLTWDYYTYIPSDPFQEAGDSLGDSSYYTVDVFIKNGRIVIIDYQGNSYSVSSEWRKANKWLLDLNYACASNNLPKVQGLLASYPSLAHSRLIRQATAQAVRYKAVEVANYLISTYKVDIHETFETWRQTGGSLDFRIVLEHTSIEALMRESGAVF